MVSVEPSAPRGGEGRPEGRSSEEVRHVTSPHEDPVRRCLMFTPPYADSQLEVAYRGFVEKHRRRDVQLWLMAATLWSGGIACSLLVREEHVAAAATGGLTGLLVLCGVLLKMGRRARPTQLFTVTRVTTFLLCALFFLSTCTGLWTPRPREDPPGGPGCSPTPYWSVVFLYIATIALPAHIKWSLVLDLIYLLTYHTFMALSPTACTQTPTSLVLEVISDAMFGVCACVLGVLTASSLDRKQRQAFEESIQSLEVKQKLEDQAQQQEELLHTVLPHHVASDIRDDWATSGSTACKDTPFKKMYMTRHEDVSILYADIVGFTALASSKSAVEIVRILNELFASFDRLAKRYSQLRIKLLGDCYYCISGAPEQRSDHAVLCVHMGLAMVQSIREVRLKTNSLVDMRVGIHSGAVLAGVLGQKQWQYDVYSKDTILANHMESSGEPGRVHISSVTLAALDGQFEVEPGFGENNDDLIRAAGLKTYFIKDVLMPYPEGTLDANKEEVEESVAVEMNNSGSPESHNDNNQVHTPTKKISTKRRNSFIYEELVVKDDEIETSANLSGLTLRFPRGQLENSYSQHCDLSEPWSVGGLLLALTAGYLGLFLSDAGRDDFQPIHFATYGLSCVVALCTLFLTTAVTKPKSKCGLLLSRHVSMPSLDSCRLPTAVLCSAVVAIADIINFTVANIPANVRHHNVSSNLTTVATSDDLIDICSSATTSAYSVLILLGLTLLSQVSYMVKVLLMVCVVGARVVVILVTSQSDDVMSHTHLVNHYLVVFAFTLCFLMYIGRHMEKSARLMFLRKRHVAEQKEKVSDMRHKNQALVLNVLPPHIARHFLGSQRKDEELYAETYEESGVLFASMPNFSDFYSEEGVNKQGLECLRLLNEVLSDYDALLSEPRFAAIYKVKTIGSTYMAASGLIQDGGSGQKNDNDRWSHLADLLEFALALKETLQKINEQSFNSFHLRIGINHGPIIAGVIGARKPHYDIWGDTVNVASRMETNALPNKIQMVEETANIISKYGYKFEKSGQKKIKGKGNMMAYTFCGKT